jgi:hypothetical protein
VLFFSQNLLKHTPYMWFYFGIIPLSAPRGLSFRPLITLLSPS